jgi:hypothetical protein
MLTSNRTTSSRSDRRRRLAGTVAPGVVIAAVVIAAVVSVGVAVRARSVNVAAEPVVRMRQRVPAVVEQEVRATVADFVAVFEARRNCIGGAELQLVRELDDGDARYVAAEDLIEIEIPTSPRRFRESLVHELAHHVDRSCPDADVLRTDVMAMIGATDWTGQERWEQRPSELWAEAVVEIVLGERVRFERSIPLDERVVDAARRWIARPPT